MIGSTLQQKIRDNSVIGGLQNMKSIVGSYIFLDIAMVTEVGDRIKVKLVNTTMSEGTTEDVLLQNIEVMTQGTGGFSTKYTLIVGDLVMLFGLRSAVEKLDELEDTFPRLLPPYDPNGIKAIPISKHLMAKTLLDIAEDGSFTLTTPKSELIVGVDGVTSYTTDGSLTLESAVEIILKAVGSASWVPNSLPNCLYTGAPHGGPAAGITGLKGS